MNSPQKELLGLIELLNFAFLCGGDRNVTFNEWVGKNRLRIGKVGESFAIMGMEPIKMQKAQSRKDSSELQ